MQVNQRVALAGGAAFVVCVLLLRALQAPKRQKSRKTKAELLALRHKLTCGAQSVSYQNTGGVVMVKGDREFLFDEEGLRFLDMRNNVAHVGHANKKVAEAVAAQVFELNTNTRYLHPNLIELAQELLSHFPHKLNKCFFVNSGSEANDLALRLAQVHTKKINTIVVDRAYHGSTCAVAGISPYKFECENGPTRRPNTHVVSCPDLYRGKYRDQDAALKYAEEVEALCESDACRNNVMCFIVESGLSVGGVILPPKPYLSRAFESVRKNGGVCIADEVQVGFGRLGAHFWGFEQQGVVPDIVTVGKPFGNGMPLAAVITTSEISDSFANGPEYFNTFGGNPVSCAAGLAMLREMKRLNLQEHARLCGNHLIAQLNHLAANYDLIGDVRGMGLFVGIEFVRSRETREAAGKEASFICSQLKSLHKILTSLDGPFDNVMVIKPPMCITEQSIDHFISCLELVIQSVAQNSQIIQQIGHTST